MLPQMGAYVCYLCGYLPVCALPPYAFLIPPLAFCFCLLFGPEKCLQVQCIRRLFTLLTYPKDTQS